MYPLWAKNPGVQQETAVAWVRRMSHMMVQASSQAARMHLPEKNYGILVKVRVLVTVGHSSIPLRPFRRARTSSLLPQRCTSRAKRRHSQP